MQGDWSTSIIILSVFYALSWPIHTVSESASQQKFLQTNNSLILTGFKKGNAHSNSLATLVPDSHCGHC